ncbi:MAG: tryptophan 7-halogenase [Hellea sp.]|nr:tryptophan 7-halogenase [Hellea sp.]
MNDRVRNIVIVGGGTAGWLTAGLLGARHKDRGPNGLSITLIESPDVPTVGVGEGTWPTIRKTLARIGLSETNFLVKCGASFKQGSRFDRWVTGSDEDSYLHPFELPVSQNGTDMLRAWQKFAPEKSFAQALCVQSAPGLQNLAPRQRSMPDFVGALNYAYHLDAVKLAEMLRTHVVETLGIIHISDHVTDINGPKDGDIKSVTTRENGDIEGDLFIDCTGHRSLMLGQHYGVDFIDQSHVLFNDRALVTQVPVDETDAIRSETISTAHEAGWIWDIGLTCRRGVGCVYASKYMSDERAEEVLRDYINDKELPVRLLKFQSGHRTHFWHQNCLAIGLSAGFLEPLEASAIVLVELSAEMLAENMPVSRQTMSVEARKFNEIFKYRWARIIEFLKLHYVLSQRTEPYWVDNRKSETIPQRLQDNLDVWTYRPPSQYDFEQNSEVFPASSYQFIVYGMGMKPAIHPTLEPRIQAAIQQQMQNVVKKQRAFAAGLPTNRALLAGLQKQSTQRKSA